MSALEAAVPAALGLIFGSFANVCIHRLPEHRSVVWPGSACPSCGSALAWNDNIPLVSWILLAGRCRACRAAIPAIYPAVEAISTLFLVGLWLQHGLSLRWVALSWLVVSILILVPIDWRHGILPDAVTLPGIGAGLLFSFVTDRPGILAAAAGAVAGALVPLGIRALYILWARARRGAEPDTEEGAEERREGMGLGDVKMLAMVGAFLGVKGVLFTMLLGSVLGTAYVLPLVAARRHTMKSAIPFGPFLGGAAIAAAFWGASVVDWYVGLLVSIPFAG